MTVFGDFLTSAAQHVAAAVCIDGLPEAATCGAVCELARLVPTLSLYLNDVLPPQQPGMPAAPALATFRVAVDARNSLSRAAAAVQKGARALEQAAVDQDHPAVRHLASASGFLAAGRDLLHTHFTTGQFGERESGSYWAPVITSTPVTGALLAGLSAHARCLAPWTLRLAAASAADGPGAVAGTALHDASAWLWAAGEGLAAATRHHPAAAAGHRLLTAVPANAVSPRRPPGEVETLGELCQQTIHTCERLRHGAWSLGQDARWSPAATSHNWRRHAFASAIIGHSSELILRALGKRAVQLGMEPGIRGQIRAAARAAHRAWDSRRVVAGAWDILSTGAPPGAVSPVAAELGDLVLRTGRLAYSNPRWTPRSGAVRLRAPDDLAHSAADLREVLAAVHHGLDAIAKIAMQEMEAVRCAATDGRIYLPTRNIPAGWRISRRYKPAPQPQTGALLHLYEKVLAADARALAAFSHLARALHTPSEILASAGATARMAVFASRSAEVAASKSSVSLAARGHQPARAGVLGPRILTPGMTGDRGGRASRTRQAEMVTVAQRR